MKPENKKFYRNLAVMVLPMAIQNLLTSLVSASDALMLGLLDQDALSAISLASQINFVEQIIVFEKVLILCLDFSFCSPITWIN